MRKKIPEAVRALLTRGRQRGHRGVFFLVGDRARDQVINLFNLWQAVRGGGDTPRVLWCYKDELGFSSQQKKRQREVSKLQRQGLYEAEAETPFELFLAATEIRFCYYREAGQVLGGTFDALVLQDFEGLTANLLCQTVETVRGGGLVFFLLKGMGGLRQLFALAMDVHARYRTERFPEVHPLFNERLLLSLCASEAALFLDDELNLLRVAGAAPAEAGAEAEAPPAQSGLDDLLLSLAANSALQRIVALCKTLDQARVLLALLEALAVRARAATERFPTIFLTAGRGRGKSAALGLAVGGALLSGTATAYLSAASADSAAVVFDFAARCFEAAGFKRGLDFLERREPGGAPLELELFVADAQQKRLLQVGDPARESVRRHRLVFLPVGGGLPHGAELLAIDEAAAIPLSLVRPLVAGARCPVLISSTVQGYEGTGRSLSLKLLEELRGESRQLTSTRAVRELEMAAPIRYAAGDPVEQWLHGLLCLGATAAAPLRRALPAPLACRLFLVRKETLLSFHRSSERFLAEMWALFVSSHYKNSPNDLQLLSDAPAHFLAVLVGPLGDGMPDILVAAQCAFEGEVRGEAAERLSGRGFRPAGDLVPWALAEQFLDKQLLGFLSVRVVRVATHPKAVKLGYGSRAVAALHRFFAEPAPPDALDMAEVLACAGGAAAGEADAPQPRRGLPPLLRAADEVRPLGVSYLSVSFGLTRPLYNFWAKSGFLPFHVKQARNDQTGEFNCMMLRPVGDPGVNFAFLAADFRRRFARLLSSVFAGLEPELALAVLDPPLTNAGEARPAAPAAGLLEQFSALDLRRLESYCRNLSEHFLIRDLLARLAELYFLRSFPAEQALSYSQALILLGVGLQGRSVEFFVERLRFSHAQVLSLFNKSVRKLFRQLDELRAQRTGEQLGFPAEEDAERFAEPVGAAAGELLGDLAKHKGSLATKRAKRA